MNTGIDLAKLAPAFGDTAASSQAVFRQCLEAMSQPGRIVELIHDAQVPSPLTSAAGAVALALLDQDTYAWLSPSLRTEEIMAYLQFHTNCRFTTAPQQSDFAFASSSAELPGLDHFCVGNDEFPELSTTVVVQVSTMSDTDGWQLSGPGIKLERNLNLGTDAENLKEQMQANRALYPRGVDMYFTHDTRLCCMPRTTHIGK